MVVVPPGFLSDREAGRRGARPTDGDALLVDRFDEALDLAVGFRRVRSEPPMKDQATLKIVKFPLNLQPLLPMNRD
jgi:hypothetical protein